MKNSHKLSAVEAVEKIRHGSLTAEALMRSCLDRVLERDELVKAWAHIDERQAIAGARNADAMGNPGPLAGIPIGVKDIIDTADMPTRNGSTIYESNQPNEDASIVRKTRSIGGVIMGKTVTTEFAWRKPGATCNPHNPEHTPGGSSSGSAAGVADYQFPLAFGTQTGGSIIRPAAYCGVVGFKPTVGTHDRKGVKELSSYLDTIGTMARSIQDVAFFDSALRGLTIPDLKIFDNNPPRIGIMVPFRANAEEHALIALERGLRKAEKSGATVIDIPTSKNFETLGDIHNTVMIGDAGRALAWEADHYPERLSRFYIENIAAGQAISDELLEKAKAEGKSSEREQAAALFEHVDILMTLPAPGEAPKGFDFTGDPLFNKVWTILGWPCVNIPFETGPLGLPLGLQIVAPANEDSLALAASAWLEKTLS
jgi:Asp-tRNA(Asn)/Glu-tRNA(Gln) amidotransferase A subunit family amidase